jgi:hypothetical protein
VVVAREGHLDKSAPGQDPGREYKGASSISIETRLSIFIKGLFASRGQLVKYPG